MTGKQTMADAQGKNMPEQAPDFAKLLEQYGGPIQFAGKGDGLYERHLVFDNVADPAAPGPRQQYEALARADAGHPLAALARTEPPTSARTPSASIIFPWSS